MKLVCLSHQKSHFIPIMNYIVNHDVKDCIFFGEEHLKCYTISKGYTFIVCRSKEILKIPEYREKYARKELSNAYRELHAELDEVIKKYNIAEIYCDISRYMFYAPIAYAKKISVTIYWTYNGPTHFNLRVSPQTSYSLSESAWGCLREWIKQFYNGEIKTKKIFFYFTYPYNFLLNIKYISRIRYCIDGFFLDTNKIVCGPKELTKYYDKTTVFDKPQIVYSIKAEGTNIEEIIKWYGTKIYISLGTNNKRYKNAVELVNNIINQLAKEKKNIIIVNVGNENEDKYCHRYSNVFFVRDIDQMYILSNVDLAIFHGGYGTLKECYYLKKKVIVIPFFYDQFSNARLIEKLKLGISLSIEDAMKANFTKLISTVTNKR